jgi:hypothetical protein
MQQGIPLIEEHRYDMRAIHFTLTRLQTPIFHFTCIGMCVRVGASVCMLMAGQGSGLCGTAIPALLTGSAYDQTLGIVNDRAARCSAAKQSTPVAA